MIDGWLINIGTLVNSFCILFQFFIVGYKIKYGVKIYRKIVSLLCYFKLLHSILIGSIKWNHNTIYFKQMRLKIDRESKPLLYPIVNLSNFKKEIIHSGTLTPWCNLPFVEGELHSLTRKKEPLMRNRAQFSRKYDSIAKL